MQVASCDARPRTREESNPRPAGPGAGARTTRPRPRTSSNNKSRKKPRVFHLDHADPRTGLRGHRRNRKKTMGFCTSTTPIPAEGRASMLEIAKNQRFLHLDHADPRRGSRGNFRNRKKPWVFAPRPRRSLQRVARAPQKSQKTMVFAPRPRRSTADGRASSAEIAKNHGFLHLDHADPRRGSRGNFRNRKKPWVFAPRPRRSPQRVDFRVVSSALPRRPKKRF